MSSIATVISVVFIFVVFALFIKQARKLKLLCKLIESATNSDNILGSLKETKLTSFVTSYEDSITIEVSENKRTNTPALEIFSDLNSCDAYQINLRLLDIGAGTLVGLGLLGTFLGLTLGISGFDSTSAQNIQNSIQTLLGGMGTAFSTSLFGMSLSMIYSFYDKFWRNKLSRQLCTLSNKLDDLYYIDDRTLDDLNEQALAQSMIKTMKVFFGSEIKKITEGQENLVQTVEDSKVSIIKTLNDELTYSNESGEISSIGNAIREVLKENQEQSKALKSFSTDLAIELNNGFDETLSRQMQQKILPLMENVDTTTRTIVEHIDNMASQVASPATDMIQTVVDELRHSMSELVQEFSSGLSSSATNEMEILAQQLATAAQAMADFPNNMGNISSTLQVTIEEVKNAVSEISNTSATANSTAMQQMQEQISFATGAIGNAISEVKEVMSGLTQSSQEQTGQMISKLSDAADKMGTFLSGTVATLSSSVQQSVKEITDDVNSKQASLIALQEDTTTKTKELLETFNKGLERLEKMNEYVSGTMNAFQQAQGQITGSTAHLQTITGDMKLATQLFNKSQNEYALKMEEMQRNSQHGIDALTDLLKGSGELSEEYVEKFETIRQGLGGIFQQLQSGLSEYSRTVQATTQKYLDQYSTSLTNTTDALSSTIQQQNEVVEMLVETLNTKKK